MKPRCASFAIFSKPTNWGLFEEVGRYLQAQGLKVSSGTIVDATLINAPSSTKKTTYPDAQPVYGPLTSPQPHLGIGAFVSTLAPGCELMTAKREPHSK
jgi:hypothetical protein